MKFVFFGYDFSLDIFDRLIEEGHEPLAVFSFPCDNQFSFNEATIARVNDLGVSATLEPPTSAQIDSLIEQGATLFVAAGYLYKIPPLDEAKAYGINVHPSYLPKGRGVIPTPYILTTHSDAAGVTVHKITEAFDRGDILLQKPLRLNPDETVETYSARVAMMMPDMVMEVVSDIKSMWEKATPQNEDDAVYFPKPSPEMRVLDWGGGVEDIAKTARAFGRFGCVCMIEGRQYAVYHLDVWREDHAFGSGCVVRQTQGEIIVSAQDGFVCLKDFELIGHS